MENRKLRMELNLIYLINKLLILLIVMEQVLIKSIFNYLLSILDKLTINNYKRGGNINEGYNDW